MFIVSAIARCRSSVGAKYGSSQTGCSFRSSGARAHFACVIYRHFIPTGFLVWFVNLQKLDLCLTETAQRLRNSKLPLSSNFLLTLPNPHDSFLRPIPRSKTYCASGAGFSVML